MKATDFNKAMGALIRKYRKTHGMTQSDFGEVLGVCYQQVQKLEHGVNAFSIFQLTKIAECFELPVAQLIEEAMGSDGSKPSTPAESDAFLVARYIARIPDSTERRHLVEYVRKRAYQGVAA